MRFGDLLGQRRSLDYDRIDADRRVQILALPDRHRDRNGLVHRADEFGNYILARRGRRLCLLDENLAAAQAQDRRLARSAKTSTFTAG